MKNIPYSTQYINKEDIKAVKKVLSNKFLTQGPVVSLFENKLRKYFNCKNVVSVSNASNALLLACAVLGVKKNTHVWCSAITFISSISCAFHLGAKFKFLDIDNNNFNLDINRLEVELKKTKTLPDILIVTHLGGNPIDLIKLKKLKAKYKFKIIEDASHALGSKIKNKKVGNSDVSEFVIFSFHPVKSITTGEGGALTTNKKELFKEAKILRSHGINRNIKNKNLKGQLDYDIYKIGYNFRLSDINAALGVSQLNRLDIFIKKRNELAKCYDKNFKGIKEITSQKILEHSRSSYHLYIIKIKNLNFKLKNKLNQVMKKNKIEINYHYVPIYKFSFNNKINIKKFKNSESYHEQAISLPIHQKLRKKDINYISKIVINFVTKNL